MKKGNFALAAILVTIGTFGLQGSSIATSQYTTSYTVTLGPNFSDVTDIIMFENGSDFGSATWPFTASDCGGSGCTTTLTNPFPSDSPVLSAVLIGITQDLPGDAPGQQHLVLFSNQAFAAAANGVDWSTLFPNTDEDQLIADVELATSGQDYATIQPGFDGLGAFLGQNDLTVPGIAQDGDGTNYGNTGDSVYFNIGDPISVVAFSTGQIIGTGTSSSLPAAHEPASLTIAGLGLVLCLASIRKRRA
jgi:hypothetical protein